MFKRDDLIVLNKFGENPLIVYKPVTCKVIDVTKADYLLEVITDKIDYANIRYHTSEHLYMFKDIAHENFSLLKITTTKNRLELCLSSPSD